MQRLDQWAEWLLKTRFQQQTDEEKKKSLHFLSGVRDKVLDRADIKEGDVVLDVGTGIGLLAFGALERMGPTGRVIASDISADCLDECHKLAQEMQVDWQMDFLQADATALTLPDESVDVVVTRSVLIYVQDKRKAAQEFFRVLRSKGRFSIFEPINGRAKLESDIDWTPVQEMRDWLTQQRERSRQEDPTLKAVLDFDEQDLKRVFEQAGFVNLDLELKWSTAWEAKSRKQAIDMLKSVGAPGQKSAHGLLLEGFPPERVDAYVEHFASQVERCAYRSVMPSAYLSGWKGPGH